VVVSIIVLGAWFINTRMQAKRLREGQAG